MSVEDLENEIKYYEGRKHHNLPGLSTFGMFHLTFLREALRLVRL